MFQRIEGSEWEELYFHYRELSKATGARKPSESQKSESSVGHEGSQRQGEDFCDLARRDNILGRNQTRLELCKALKCLEDEY